MQVTKTVKVPIHYLTTNKKLSYLDNITARLTCAVHLWSDIIKRSNIKHRKDLQNLGYQHYIQRKTKLSAGYVQQCGNKALWMWKQYRKVHGLWKWKLKHTEKDTKWYDKLKKREQSKPFSNKNTLLHKIPVRLDYRTGEVKQVDLKLTDWIAEISTLKKNHKMVLLLNPARYHKDLLNKGKIRDFEIVKKGKKYYAHIVCQYEVKDVKPKSLLSIDLGINRTLTAVLFGRNKEPMSMLIKDEEKQKKLQFYNDLFSKLKQGKHWKKLSQLRNKRRNIAEYYDWLTANQLAELVTDNVVIIGKVTHIREKQYKGNGDKKHRKRINRWAYLRIGNMIAHKLSEKGILVKQEFEPWSSKTCSFCGSTNTIRPIQEALFCFDCLNGFDADKNGATNHARNFLSKYAIDGLAVTKDDLVLKPSMSLETLY